MPDSREILSMSLSTILLARNSSSGSTGSLLKGNTAKQSILRLFLRPSAGLLGSGEMEIKVSHPDCSFDVARVGGRVTQGLTQHVDRLVQATLEITKRTGRPQAVLDFFSRAYLSRAFQQQGQNF